MSEYDFSKPGCGVEHEHDSSCFRVTVEWASQAEIQERWHSETISHRPVVNYMEDGLWDSFVIVGQAMRDFLAVVGTETDRQVSRFYNWLDLTEQIHSATVGK